MAEHNERFSDRVYSAVSGIPKGSVATYAMIAALAGNPKAARAVGNILHKNPFFGTVPCHRVVNRNGFPSCAFAFGGADFQRELLENEGVNFIDGHVDMEKHLWKR